MFNTSSHLDQRLVGLLFFVWSVAGGTSVGLAAFDDGTPATVAVAAPAPSTSTVAQAHTSSGTIVAVASAR